jgi:OOP family OmpA-OmpF porin
MEGTSESNDALALRRAQAVLDYMVKAGVDAQQLEPAGYGEKRPVAPNDTAENRAKNRRIEFVVRPK